MFRQDLQTPDNYRRAASSGKGKGRAQPGTPLRSEAPSGPQITVINILVRVCPCALPILIFQYAPGDTDFTLDTIPQFISPNLQSEYFENEKVSTPTGPQIMKIVQETFKDRSP
jgi:hypothetical protein